MSTYLSVTRIAESVGFKVQNVVYRGYQASDQLQHMHDSAIQSRTKLHHEHDVAEQLQRLEDMKITKRLERSMQEMQLEQAAKEHQLKLINLEHKENLVRKELEHKEIIRQKHLDAETDLRFTKLKNQEQLSYYTELKSLGVNLTQLLCTQNQPVNKLIKIEAPNNGSTDKSSTPHLIFNVEENK